MRSSNILTLTLGIGFAALLGCVMVPESPHTWVAYQAAIEPVGPDGRWTAEEIKFIRDSLTASATQYDLKPTREWIGPDLLAIGRRKNEKALANLAGGKANKRCYLAEYSQGGEVRIKAYYLPWTGLIHIDYNYTKRTPITPLELQQCESQWATFFEPLNTRIGSRLTVRPDKVLQRND